MKSQQRAQSSSFRHLNLDCNIVGRSNNLQQGRNGLCSVQRFSKLEMSSKSDNRLNRKKDESRKPNFFLKKPRFRAFAAAEKERTANEENAE
jgi:hypothetical protein